MSENISVIDKLNNIIDVDKEVLSVLPNLSVLWPNK